MTHACEDTKGYCYFTTLVPMLKGKTQSGTYSCKLQDQSVYTLDADFKP